MLFLFISIGRGNSVQNDLELTKEKSELLKLDCKKFATQMAIEEMLNSEAPNYLLVYQEAFFFYYSNCDENMIILDGGE